MTFMKLFIWGGELGETDVIRFVFRKITLATVWRIGWRGLEEAAGRSVKRLLQYFR